MELCSRSRLSYSSVCRLNALVTLRVFSVNSEFLQYRLSDTINAKVNWIGSKDQFHLSSLAFTVLKKLPNMDVPLCVCSNILRCTDWRTWRHARAHIFVYIHTHIHATHISSLLSGITDASWLLNRRGTFLFPRNSVEEYYRAACKSDNIRVRFDKILVASPYTLRTGARSCRKKKKKRTAFIYLFLKISLLNFHLVCYEYE